MMLRVSFLFNSQNSLKKRLIYTVHFDLFRRTSRKIRWIVSRLNFSAPADRNYRVRAGLSFQHCFLFATVGLILSSFSAIISIFPKNRLKCNRQRFLWNSDGNSKIYIDDIGVYNSHRTNIRSPALHGFDGVLSAHAQAALGGVSK